MIETGSGFSTKVFSRIAKKSGAIVHSIDVEPPSVRFPNVGYHQGWSVAYDDLIQPGDRECVCSRYETVDGRVALDGE